MQLDAKGDSWISIMYKLHWDDYFKTIFLYRVRKVKLSRVITNRNKRNFFIPYDVVIGENLIYDHPYSTILNAKSIGRNFKFKHLVTIGNVGDNEDLRPTIGNDVTFGANVTVIGKITIGDNVIIGAGTTVTKDVPANSVVVGQPFRILKNGK